MKIRNRLIHLLGGYTKNEYLMNNNTKVRTPIFCADKPTRTLKAGYCIADQHRQPPEKWVKNELMARLANRILDENLVGFYTAPKNTGESEYPQEVTAIIRVVEPFDRTEMGFGYEVY